MDLLDSNKETIIITGGTGFIGSHTCVELAGLYNIVIIDNFSNSHRGVVSKLKTLVGDFILYDEDVLNYEKIDNLFQEHKPKAVIHFAGLKAVGESISKPLKYYENNLVSTLNLLKTMEKHKCYNLIFSSSATVYGNQKSPLDETMNIGQGITNPYGETKFMIETILKDMCKSNPNWNIISLRYFNPIGAHHSGLIGENPNDIPNNLMPFILKVGINNNTEYNLGPQFNELNIFANDYNTNDGTCMRDFIHVVDLAKGHLAAIRKIDQLSGYSIFNLGTGKPTSVLELVETFKNVNNLTIPYKFSERRQGDIDICFCDPSHSYKILEWKTEKTLDDMCIDSWKFQKLNPKGI
jgi:UDP-glucose 4-epimerase